MDRDFKRKMWNEIGLVVVKNWEIISNNEQDADSKYNTLGMVTIHYIFRAPATIVRMVSHSTDREKYAVRQIPKL